MIRDQPVTKSMSSSTAPMSGVSRSRKSFTAPSTRRAPSAGSPQRRASHTPVFQSVPRGILGQSVADGQELRGLVVWRVDVRGRAQRVEFLVDGVLRGTDVAAPYTLGLNADAEPPGEHRLTARAVGANGKAAEAVVTVSMPPPSSGTG